MSGFTDEELVKILPKLKYNARRFVVLQEDVEDLVSETIIKALQYRDRFEAGSNLIGWTFFIMRNLFFTKMRRNKFVGETYENAELDLPAVSNLSAPIELKEVLEFMKGLPEDRVEALMLIALGDTYEEVSELLNTDVGTIKSRVSRARTDINSFFQ